MENTNMNTNKPNYVYVVEDYDGTMCKAFRSLAEAKLYELQSLIESYTDIIDCEDTLHTVKEDETNADSARNELKVVVDELQNLVHFGYVEDTIYMQTVELKEN